MTEKKHKIFNVEDINTYKKLEVTNKIVNTIKKNNDIEIEKLVSICFLEGIGENTTLKTLKHLKNSGKINIDKDTEMVHIND